MSHENARINATMLLRNLPKELISERPVLDLRSAMLLKLLDCRRLRF